MIIRHSLSSIFNVMIMPWRVCEVEYWWWSVCVASALLEFISFISL